MTIRLRDNETRISIIIQYLDDDGKIINDLHVSTLDTIIDSLLLDQINALIRRLIEHDEK